MKKALLLLSGVFLASAVFCQNNLKKSPVLPSKATNKNVALFDDIHPAVPTVNNPLVQTRGSEIAIGTAFNIYSVLLDGQNQTAYDANLNAMAFVHRQNAGSSGGSGRVSYDYSIDGGNTWQADNKQITPTLDLSGNGTNIGNGNRYPSCAIYNPPGNTDPANAYIVAVGPSLHTDPVYGNGWGWEFVASAPLVFDASKVSEKYYTNADTTSFHPYGLTANPDGSLWYVSTTWNTDKDPDATTAASYGKLYVCKLTFNGTGFDREVKIVLQPNWGFVADSAWHIQGDYNMAWSPDGKTGYVVFVTTDIDNENVGDGIGVKPVIWKTTDSGETWTKYAQVDYQSMQELLDWTFFTDTNGDGLPNDTSGDIRPYMNSIDVTCDKNGDLHIFANMYSRSTTAIDSMGWGWFAGDSISTLFHFITDGVNWDASYVDLWACDGGTLGAVGVGVRTQASRSADGNVVFFTYLQSLNKDATIPDIFADVNNAPDIFAYAYNLDTGVGAWKRLTDPDEDYDLLLEGKYFFATMAPVSATGGNESYYELPVVVAEPNADGSDLSPPQFWYVFGVGFEEKDLTSTREPITNVDLSVYPNPTSGILNVVLNDPSVKADIIVSNAMGSVVQQLNKQSGSVFLNLGQQPAGVYYLTIRTEQGITARKVLLTK
jgi:hypothetical protein